MGLYIVKVNDLFLSDERGDSRFTLTENPQDYGFEFYKDKEKAQIVANKINGKVIALTEDKEVHR